MKTSHILYEKIQPETDLETSLLEDPEFVEGALWGKPRNGHPEGQVLLHIEAVLKNIDNIDGLEPVERQELRFIALIHDTFKYKVNLGQPKSGENHHAMIARRFAEKFIANRDTLDIIELHDEAYNSWCKGDRDDNWDKAETRARKLIKRLGESIDIYLIFYMCDNETGGKQGHDYKWFKNLVEKCNNFLVLTYN